ncbi:MAG: hypothetical protein GXY60_06405 [Spirochaetales bacterium]|jgi:hypothetical protein|nr:hypothetical protein [Spirochaetales bacterium]
MVIRKHSFFVVLMLVCIFVSCSQEHVSVGSIRLVIDSERAFSARNIDPAGTDPLTATRYSITGSGPNGAAIDTTVDAAGSVIIGNLAIGNWMISVTALNDDEVSLVSGTCSTYVSSGESTVEMVLDTLVGSGVLEISYSWPPDQSDESITLTTVITDVDGNAVEHTQPAVDWELGTATLLVNALDSGFYMVGATLKYGDEVIAGSLETARIIDGTESSGTCSLTIGSLVDEFLIEVIDATMLPIEGTLTCSSTELEKGDSFTLTFASTDLGETPSEDYSIQWYCDGQAIQDADGLTLEVVSALGGTHRYDIVISHTSIGSIGSKAILVTVPVDPIFSVPTT